MQLIAGSGNTDSSNDGNSAEVSAGGGGQAEKDDGYQAGIPGPITRLFIIANRGIANLMQDLILVRAENSTFTSESCINSIAFLTPSCLSFPFVLTDPQPQGPLHIPCWLSVPSYCPLNGLVLHVFSIYCPSLALVPDMAPSLLSLYMAVIGQFLRPDSDINQLLTSALIIEAVW